jgi:hypothetical protein
MSFAALTEHDLYDLREDFEPRALVTIASDEMYPE